MQLFYRRKSIQLTCTICNTAFSHYVGDYEPRYIKEFEQWENLSIPCPFCDAVRVINLNIPELDEMEKEIMEKLAPPEEVHNRKTIRAIMWDVRPDLKKQFKKTYREKYLQKNRN